MSVKRYSRTAECPVDSQGISAVREFRRNIEDLIAGEDNSQPREKHDSLTGEIRDDNEKFKQCLNKKI